MDDIGKAGQVVGVVYSERQSLDTVRALHQTVVSLRAALEQSRVELHSLRRQIESKVDSELYKDTIEKLSLENHILRRKVLSSGKINYAGLESGKKTASSMSSIDKIKPMEPSAEKEKEESKQLPEEQNGVVEQNSIENGEEVERSLHEDGDQSVSSATSQHGAGTPLISKGESEDSEELDDIELIFTTDDTKELSALQEDLVSFAETEVWHNKGSDGKELDYPVVNSNLKHTWTQSVLVETDISKCGVVDDIDTLAPSSRRNTLPNPTPYRPIIHREALSGSKSQLLDPAPTSPRPVIVKFSQHNAVHSPRTTRPILVEKNSTKQESEAQTDITALPAHWKSESFLAHHKVSHNFTTLPSKFSLPVQSPPRKQSLKLSEKTQEARRVLLSDINFTSMVPELSRSADHLCNEAINTSSLCRNYPRAFTYMKNADSVMSPGYLGRTPWSPCDCNHRQPSWEYYQGSTVSIPSPSVTDLMETSKRRHSMRPSTSSLDTYWTNTYTPRPNWSVPTSPTHCRRSRSVPFSTSYTHSTPQPESSSYLSTCRIKKAESKFSPVTSVRSIKPPTTSSKGRNRVTFQEINVRHPGHSLPDLRLPLGTESGEDSTDSLIDESEEFLRRSIDSMLTGVDYNHIGRRRRMRRHSDPDPVREFEPPKSAQPFLAKVPRDIKLDYWVKIITAEGRVVMGRVRYVGPLPQQNEIHIGVQLAKSDGNTDGTYNGRRYFDCDPDFGVFVPFKKVVMAWST